MAGNLDELRKKGEYGMAISYSDLEDAFMFVGSGFVDSTSVAIHKETGKTYYMSEMSDVDEFPEDVDGGNYVFVPDKRELDLGQSLVFDFTAKYLPEKLNEVEAIFRRRGAYRNFKDMLLAEGKLDEWHQFEQERTRQALLEWAEDCGLKVE